MSFFGSFKDSLLDGAKTGMESGDLNAGNVVNSALDTALSTLPFGDVIKGVLDKLGLQENINLVSKYGISSWGASTSPEVAKGLIAKNVLPYLEQKLGAIDVNNVSKIINEIEDNLLANHYFFTAMRDNHSKAKSTRLANDYTQKEFRKLANEFTSAVTTEFGKHGVKFQRVTSNETGRQLAEAGVIYNLKDNLSWIGGPSRDLDRYLAKQYYNWNVDFSGVKNLEKDENGQLVAKKSGGGMFAMLGLAGFAIFKFMK